MRKTVWTRTDDISDSGKHTKETERIILVDRINNLKRSNKEEIYTQRHTFSNERRFTMRKK